MTYERTVAAAVVETKSKFALAEALALDIPPRHAGGSITEDRTIEEHLEEARQAVVVAGGEPKTTSTYRDYRNTALWVRKIESSPPGGNTSDLGFRWLDGASFTAHRRAMEAGLTFEQFAELDKHTGDAAWEAAGRPAIRTGPSTTRDWSVDQKVKAARELLNEPEVAEQVASDKQSRSTMSQATDDYYQQQAQQRAERTERKATEDGTDRRIDSVLWVNRLGEAHERYAREVNEALRHVGELPETERYWLTGAVDRAESSLRATRRYLELGKSEFDAELETLLQNGA